MSISSWLPSTGKVLGPGQGVWAPFLNSVLFLIGKACQHEGADYRLLRATCLGCLEAMLCPALLSGLCSALVNTQPPGCQGWEGGGH